MADPTDSTRFTPDDAMMARFIMINRISDPAQIKEFDTGGYTHATDLSHSDRWAFVQPYPQHLK